MDPKNTSETQTCVEGQPVSSAELALAIAAEEFGDCEVIVVGYGFMGKAYVQALQSLRVGSIQVCSRSPERLEALRNEKRINVNSGGFINVASPTSNNNLAIIATPTSDLVGASKHLATLGYGRMLVEKPVSFRSTEICELGDYLERTGVDGRVAYNRLAYPSLVEARFKAHQDGGITSCSYSATELIRENWPELYSKDELAYWGVANTLHVIGMAHGLIGYPSQWNCSQAGSMAWHPTGSIFVGSGVSQEGIPFSYHGDWKSKGRWSVDIHTDGSSYRMCPLERLLVKTDALSEWEEVPLTVFDDRLKAGIAEEVAAMLSPRIRRLLPLITMRQTTELTRYAEEIFGYNSSPLGTH